MISREQLETYTFPKIQQELLNRGVSVVPQTRERSIDMLLDLMERNVPGAERTTTPDQEIKKSTDFYPNIANQEAIAFLSSQMKEQRKEQLNFNMEIMQKMQQMFAAFAINNNQPASLPQEERIQPHSNTEIPQQSDCTIQTASVSHPQTAATQVSDHFTMTSSNAAKFLSSQVPTFTGTEEDNIETWLEKLESLAEWHNYPQNVLLSAATSRLTKTARRWFDLSPSTVSKSWSIFKSSILDRFRRKIFYGDIVQKIENRKWLFYKETFADYAMDKMALMQPLKLKDEDAIQMLNNGIANTGIRATAMLLRLKPINEYLREMEYITAASSSQHKKYSPVPKPKFEKSKMENKTSPNPDHQSKIHKDIYCVYCKTKGHIRDNCLKLKKREQHYKPPQSPTTSQVAVVEKVPDSPSNYIALITEDKVKEIVTDCPIIKVTEINDFSCKLVALLDTGSPISLISLKAFKKYFSNNQLIVPTNLSFKGINNMPIKILGLCNSIIKLELLPNFPAAIQVHVLEDNLSAADIIIGRDFTESHKITIVIKPSSREVNNRLQLFSEIASVDIIENISDQKDNTLNNIAIDFDQSVKVKLIAVIKEVNNVQVPLLNDDYSVKINLKDKSIYAYAPRRFAWAERLQIRDIIDDLLNREIIKESTSPYCARVVPVRKKNGSLRLCVDLRPLNDRVIKQKYPFPLIEDCLARLSNKTVFTLLDLKDGFHHIKVHPDYTKFFAFATPDGQYEFLRLPFGFCEAPAEFQKRLVYILRALIKKDQVLVYIDDILIPTNNIQENINILKEVLILLKTHNFKLNYDKCKFLKTKVEYLGYIISSEGVTLSNRHVEAVKSFPLPRKLIEVQRFLGLTNYFRKFIENYATIANPLQKQLRKNSDFHLDSHCVEAFNLLKEKLTSYPILQLYNPGLPTELHTDASAVAVAGILLQKQDSGNWATIAYYSQATNKAETRYHSFELEMLAVVKSVERFHIYLYGIEFTIITDCHALVFAINKAHLNPRIARWTLRLQNYKFKVIHRNGIRMSHVDALSRIVCYTESISLEKELQFRQLQDEKLKNIAEYLESNEHTKYELLDGLVFKKGADKSRFIIPESMVHNVIRVYHDEMSHCGYEKTVQGITTNYWFPTLRKKVQHYIENCIICLINNSSINSREGELQITDTPSMPFQIVHIDHYGPIIESVKGFKHILLVVDAFTRFTWLFPTKSTSTKEVIVHLTELFCNFGNPAELISDRGSSFTSHEFAEFLKTHKVHHHLVAVAAPWANGLVERINRFLQSSLRKVIDNQNNWSDKISSIQYTINNTYHKSIKTTPSMLLLGYDQRNHADATLITFLNNFAKVELNYDLSRENSRNLALEATNKIKQYNKAYYDIKHKKPSLYKTGDYVLIRDSIVKPGENKKLKPQYKGPYLVHKVLQKNRYVIQDIPGFNITSKPYNTILSTDRMKPWIKPLKPNS